LMPRFLRKRRAGLPALQETIEEVTRRLGLDRRTFFTLVLLRQIQGSYDDNPITVSEIRSWSTFLYSTIDATAAPLATLKEKGLLHEDAGGALDLSREAREAVDQLHATARAQLARLQPLAPGDLGSLTGRLERTVQGILNDPVLSPRPGSHLAGSRSLATFGPDAPAMVRLEQAIFDLWMARDDAHIKSWRDAGLEGPAMQVLTLLWLGEANTVSGLAELLREDQSPEDLESSLAYLTAKELTVQHGDLVQLTPKGVLEREDIERDTDHIYFAPWPPFTLLEARWLRDELRALVDNLPAPAPLR
ncbi:MAG: hypothetical protein M3328_17640, partial [Chloroflexota bacterium]|nr:hypothetical protein [Chloroflexota bacterium]